MPALAAGPTSYASARRLDNGYIVPSVREKSDRLFFDMDVAMAWGHDADTKRRPAKATLDHPP